MTSSTSRSGRPAGRRGRGRDVRASSASGDGRIVAVEAARRRRRRRRGSSSSAPTRCCCPGLVDTHVHVNEPGRTEWEGFATATRAAAAGGVTTIVDMPLNSIPPTTTIAALRGKAESAPRGQAHVDVGFWGGAVPGNLARPRGRCTRPACSASSASSSTPGCPSSRRWTPAEFAAAMAETARLGALLIVHAEDAAVDRRSAAGRTARAYAGFLRSRPPRGREPRGRAGDRGGPAHRRPRAHAAPVAAPTRCPTLRAARAAGADVSVETCPHYLAFDAEEVPDGATQFKCCPPIRERGQPGTALGRPGRRRHRHGRLRPLALHRPSSSGWTPATSAQAWGGIASVQLGAARGVDRGPRPRAPPRRRRAVDGRRRRPTGSGLAAQGPDRDRRRRRPGACSRRTSEFVVDAATGCSTGTPCRPTPAARLTGVVRQTWLRGDTGRRRRRAPRGRLLRRGQR